MFQVGWRVHSRSFHKFVVSIEPFALFSIFVKSSKNLLRRKIFRMNLWCRLTIYLLFSALNNVLVVVDVDVLPFISLHNEVNKDSPSWRKSAFDIQFAFRFITLFISLVSPIFRLILTFTFLFHVRPSLWFNSKDCVTKEAFLKKFNQLVTFQLNFIHLHIIHLWHLINLSLTYHYIFLKLLFVKMFHFSEFFSFLKFN